MSLYARRLLIHRLVIVLSILATAFGLLWLALVLSTLLVNGIGAIGPSLFVQMTPPPGSAGGLLNAIAGSVAMTLIATLVGTPPNIYFAGYMRDQGLPIDFGRWMLFATPLSWLYLLIAWWLLTHWLFPVRLAEIPGGREAARKLFDLPEPPTAIFAFNDNLAIGAIQAARRRGLRVPEDVSIVGFDDVEHATIVTPPLTTVRQPLAEMGRAAATLLLERIGTNDELPPRRRVFPVGLVHRDTLAAAPAA
jgi:hypothetical protein